MGPWLGRHCPALPCSPSAPGAGRAWPWHRGGCSWGTGSKAQGLGSWWCDMAVTLLSLWHQCQAWWVCGQCSATGGVHLHRSALGEVSAGALHMRCWTLSSCESQALPSSLDMGEPHTDLSYLHIQYIDVYTCIYVCTYRYTHAYVSEHLHQCSSFCPVVAQLHCCAALALWKIF